MTKSVLQFEQALSKLAVLMANGHSNSKEANNLRDKMLDIYHEMTEEEDKFTRMLSSDLYMIENDEILESPVDNLEFDFQSNYYLNAWTDCLEILRKDMSWLNNEYRAYYRGEIYSKLECYSSALEFYRTAIRLNHWNLKYYIRFVRCLINCWKIGMDK